MNQYRITAQQSDGSTVTDHKIELTESAARKAFRLDYPVAFYTITAVELVAENVPATKDQERRALEKIKAIVADLGPNSYVGTAFSGCFCLAEWNIECDGSDSFSERVEVAQAKACEETERAKIAETELKKTQLVSDNYAKENNILHTRVSELEESVRMLDCELAQEKKNAADLKNSLETMHQEVIILKAKLYDLIVIA